MCPERWFKNKHLDGYLRIKDPDMAQKFIQHRL